MVSRPKARTKYNYEIDKKKYQGLDFFYISLSSLEILDAYIKDVSQSSTLAPFDASLALDKNLNTFQHHASTPPPNWWKVEFYSTVFIQTVKIINRLNCRFCPNRGNNIDVIATLVLGSQQHDTICANTGPTEAEKTLDCYHFADEITLSGNQMFNIIEVYILGKSLA